MFNLDKILYKIPTDLSDQEWEFLNNLDFDSLFKKDGTNKRNYRFSLRSILFGLLVFDKDLAEIPCVSQLLNLVSHDNKITNKGMSFIRWAILNKFNHIVDVIDVQFDLAFHLTFQVDQIFSLIPVDKHGILLSLSKNPSKMAELIAMKCKIQNINLKTDDLVCLDL